MNTQLVRSEFKMLYLTVMNIELKASYVKMLQKMIDIENQLIGYLPTMSENASNAVLADTIARYTRDITIERDRVRRILIKHRVPTTTEHNEVFGKFLRDMGNDMLRISDNAVRDSFIVSTLQMIRHIRVSKYNTLLEWADFLKERDDQELIETTLYEEREMETALSSLAKKSVLSVENLREHIAN